MSSSQERRPHWPAVVLLLILLPAGIALVMETATYRPSRSAGRRTQCLNNIRGLALAITNYASANGGSLPPPFIADASGRPMHSWRVLLLPYLDQRALYDKYRFDEPWDGPNNRKLHDVVPEVFRCPDGAGGRKSTATSYLAVVGPETAWPPKRRLTLDEIAAGDGLANTLLLVEVADSGIHWLEPRDLDFASMSFRINDRSGKGISSRHPGAVMVAFADCRAKPLSETTSPNVVRALLTSAGCEPLGESDF